MAASDDDDDDFVDKNFDDDISSNFEDSILADDLRKKSTLGDKTDKEKNVDSAIEEFSPIVTSKKKSRAILDSSDSEDKPSRNDETSDEINLDDSTKIDALSDSADSPKFLRPETNDNQSDSDAKDDNSDEVSDTDDKSDNPVIDLVSEPEEDKEEEVPLSEKDIQILEGELRNKKRALENLKKIMTNPKHHLPDKGEKLKKLVAKQETDIKGMEAKLRSVQRMPVSSLNCDEQGKGGSHVITAQQKLDLLLKKRTLLNHQMAMVRPDDCSGKEGLLKIQISNVNDEIMALQKDIQLGKLNPSGKSAILLDDVPKNPHNSAWQQFRSEIGESSGGAYQNPNLWAKGPAANALYGGRMTSARQHEVVTVTQVQGYCIYIIVLWYIKMFLLFLGCS